LARLLEQCSIRNYIIELGGEIRVKGRKPGNQQMKIGIESPATADIEAGIFKRILAIDSGAITTSGNYRRFYESGGKHITHLFNPHTGYSINNELIAATVYASDAMTADGYDNALMNMGLKKALGFVSKQNKIAAYFVYIDDRGNVRDTASPTFYKLFQ
jgi:thiamine biosynthesis lipoprotein